jgi:hypothetical protein
MFPSKSVCIKTLIQFFSSNRILEFVSNLVHLVLLKHDIQNWKLINQNEFLIT